MGWLGGVVILSLLQYMTESTELSHSIDFSEDMNDEGLDKSLNSLSPENIDDIKLEYMGKVLTNILLQPWPKGISPILYVESSSSGEIHEPFSNEMEQEGLHSIPYKRTRIYRKYPWKRQNSRYDAENRYLCQPTKEDVFRLLVALHEARQGVRGQMINFCNRKRPASAIFTSIRFMG